MSTRFDEPSSTTTSGENKDDRHDDRRIVSSDGVDQARAAARKPEDLLSHDDDAGTEPAGRIIRSKTSERVLALLVILSVAAALFGTLYLIPD